MSAASVLIGVARVRGPGEVRVGAEIPAELGDRPLVDAP